MKYMVTKENLPNFKIILSYPMTPIQKEMNWKNCLSWYISTYLIFHFQRIDKFQTNEMSVNPTQLDIRSSHD